MATTRDRDEIVKLRPEAGADIRPEAGVSTSAASSPVPTPSPVPIPEATRPPRLASIDAYRGLVMFLMMAEVLHLRSVYESLREQAKTASVPMLGLWERLAHHQTHVAWVGCSLHDLIQPSFSFLVGVALPFSMAARAERGQSRTRMIVHALWRSLLLVALGIFLRSLHRDQTYFTFEDTLCQIGLGYPFLFVLGFASTRVRWIALGVLLVGYWGAFAACPAPGPQFDYAAANVPRSFSEHPTGFAAHWDINSNAAWAFDVWFLNKFPREKPFIGNSGGYSTLSFVPTLATMLLGLLAGDVLRRPWKTSRKLLWLIAAGAVGLGAGWGLGALGVCPVVKRIWTPSWALFSGGWCFLFLAGFYAIIDGAGVGFWAFPLRVIGMNSIAAYCMADLFGGFFSHNLTIHLGKKPFLALGAPYEPLLHGAAVLLIFWFILFWMYRRKIFLKI